MYQAYKGNARVGDFDPKALVPMVWIGEFWRLGVWIFHLAAIFGGPCLLIALLVPAISRNRPPWLTAFSFLSLAVTMCTLLFSPRYAEWLMD
jgi:hypothetical protein